MAFGFTFGSSMNEDHFNTVAEAVVGVIFDNGGVKK